MNHVKGWTVLSKDYRSILLANWRERTGSDQWSPIANADFKSRTDDEALLCDTEETARGFAAEVGGVVHRVDRQE